MYSCLESTEWSLVLSHHYMWDMAFFLYHGHHKLNSNSFSFYAFSFCPSLTRSLLSILCRKFIKSFLQGFLPGLALKIFLYILPTVLMIMSKIEGHIAFSTLERKAASKYYYFMLVNVFLGSIVTGTAFEQLHSFLHQSATE